MSDLTPWELLEETLKMVLREPGLTQESRTTLERAVLISRELQKEAGKVAGGGR